MILRDISGNSSRAEKPDCPEQQHSRDADADARLAGKYIELLRIVHGINRDDEEANRWQR